MGVVDDFEGIGERMSFSNGSDPQLTWLKNRNSRRGMDPAAICSGYPKRVAMSDLLDVESRL
jgi:hypothetical protein